MIGRVSTPAGDVPKVSTELTSHDSWGTFKARWSIGRMDYKVEPGLYAVGEPDADSVVLVTANYKMSFDWLRGVLSGRSAWIMVVDTDGINVWCAAGKGTFGTNEVVERIDKTELARVVSHRRLVLPQLSGPGVAAHKVKDLSGFKVVYGPVRAEDLPAFLDHAMKASPEMRQKTFTTRERTVLIPVELVEALKAAVFLVPVLLVIGGLLGRGPFWTGVWRHGGLAALSVVFGIAAGSVMTPILLPWLPGKSFSVKGILPGLFGAAILLVFWSSVAGTPVGVLEASAGVLLVLALTCYLALNFTGASTYTSLSGVKKEMRWAVPLEITAAVAGLGMWLGSVPA